MEVVQTSQCFELADGFPQYAYSKVLLRCGDDLYSARSSTRIPTGSKKIDPGTLTATIPIPTEAYCPLFTSEMTQAPDPLPSGCFIKQPNLINYEPGSDIHQYVLQDIQACELLKRFPHDNIAYYYGCQVSNGRVIGLCFKSYSKTLMQAVNPGSLNKHDFLSADVQTAIQYLPGIANGITHIHSLGLAHNDINPSNIMLDEDVAVIVDFDSCVPIGSPLENIKRTYGWHDVKVQVSDPTNDWDALAEIHTWLRRSTEQTFKF